MSVHTRSQRLAQAAYRQVSNRQISDKYTTMAKKFPALIHTCGLAQAVAFGISKREYHDYLEDLTSVLKSLGYPMESPTELDAKSRDAHLYDYVRLSRDAINAASWLKRYVEAVSPESEQDDE